MPVTSRGTGSSNWSHATTTKAPSSEVRWLVLPERPAGTESLSEDQLVPLITREAMVGVAKIEAP